jgi:hypothetical protein
MSLARPKSASRARPLLHVTVDQAGRLARGERARDGVHDVERALRRDAALAADEIAQRLALDEVHHQKDDALGLADVVDGDDVGVAELRLRARLAEESGARRHRVRDEHLEGHGPEQAHVPGAVHAPHAAPADERVDPEMTEHVAKQRVEHGAGRGGGERAVGRDRVSARVHRREARPRGRPHDAGRGALVRERRGGGIDDIGRAAHARHERTTRPAPARRRPKRPQPARLSRSGTALR